ncbi:MAG: PrsW family intramembrane metalloprotease [Treponema sp.]|nr:PrsW family intramembrane metalloprotease [Treponema sp.]
MGGLWVLLLLIAISSLPLIPVYIWFRVSHVPVTRPRFLCALLTGAAAIFPALFLQDVFSRLGETLPVLSGRGNLLAAIFFPIAFTEEFSRLLTLLILFGFFRLFDRKNPEADPFALADAKALKGNIQSSALGLAAGFGFAIIESAAYGAADIGAALLRAFTSAPLHGACGARIGSAAAILKKQPLAALLRFITAVAIHGMYNFMIIKPGFPAVIAVLIALSALGSSILVIRNGREKTAKDT